MAFVINEIFDQFMNNDMISISDYDPDSNIDSNNSNPDSNDSNPDSNIKSTNNRIILLREYRRDDPKITINLLESSNKLNFKSFFAGSDAWIFPQSTKFPNIFEIVSNVFYNLNKNEANNNEPNVKNPIIMMNKFMNVILFEIVYGNIYNVKQYHDSSYSTKAKIALKTSDLIEQLENFFQSKNSTILYQV